jgi:hypothetical protein
MEISGKDGDLLFPPARKRFSGQAGIASAGNFPVPGKSVAGG